MLKSCCFISKMIQNAFKLLSKQWNISKTSHSFIYWNFLVLVLYFILLISAFNKICANSPFQFIFSLQEHQILKLANELVESVLSWAVNICLPPLSSSFPPLSSSPTSSSPTQACRASSSDRLSSISSITSEEEPPDLSREEICGGELPEKVRNFGSVLWVLTEVCRYVLHGMRISFFNQR